MIIKKIIPLMGISVLLLLVNLPQADADLCGDIVFLRVLNEDTGAVVFDGSGVVPNAFAANILIAPFVQIDVQVNCDDDGDGVSTIFFDYVSAPTGPEPFPVPNHSFWFTDLDWTNEAGEVIGYSVDAGKQQTPSLMTTGFGPREAHATTGAFSINADSSMLNNLILTARHGGIASCGLDPEDVIVILAPNEPSQVILKKIDCNAGILSVDIDAKDCENSGIDISFDNIFINPSLDWRGDETITNDDNAVPGDVICSISFGIKSELGTIELPQIITITTPEPTVVGGELLPIDSTALLLAAAQSPASWLATLTIAALGIGAYVFTRNPNNMRNIKVILRDYLDRF